MENIEEFEKWLQTLLKDAKKKLEMKDSTIAWLLLREGTEYYFRSITKKELEDEK